MSDSSKELQPEVPKRFVLAEVNAKSVKAGTLVYKTLTIATEIAVLLNLQRQQQKIRNGRVTPITPRKEVFRLCPRRAKDLTIRSVKGEPKEEILVRVAPIKPISREEREVILLHERILRGKP